MLLTIFVLQKYYQFGNLLFYYNWYNIYLPVHIANVPHFEKIVRWHIAENSFRLCSFSQAELITIHHNRNLEMLSAKIFHPVVPQIQHNIFPLYLLNRQNSFSSEHNSRRLKMPVLNIWF